MRLSLVVNNKFMQHINRSLVALSLGSFAGFTHLIWSILLAIGWAKPLLDFILNVHHISLNYSLLTFSLGRAVLLIVVTFAVGYVFGFVFATIWNMHTKNNK
jgi:hypothetical protein